MSVYHVPLFRNAVMPSDMTSSWCGSRLFAEMRQLQEDVAEASEHEVFELFIGLLILLNVAIMAIDHHGSPEFVNELISRANAVSVKT